jgi:16S rRNA (uracil1498-N3)-methyltransferase
VRGKDARYLSRVLRLLPGDSFDAMDGEGRAWKATLVSADGESVRLALESVSAGHGEAGTAGSETRISLYQCLPKGGKMDLIARQAAEAGVARVIPVISDHSVPRHTARDERWERVIKEARQQSGSRVDTKVEALLSLHEAVNDWSGRGPAFFFHEKPLAETSLHRYLSCIPAEAAVMVGPEGGLSRDETAFLASAGWLPIYLGQRVLRAETAALYAVAAVQILLLEHETWALKPDFPQNA